MKENYINLENIKYKYKEDFTSESFLEFEDKELFYMEKKEDRVGEKYGELTIVEYIFSYRCPTLYHYYICNCKCGNKKIANYKNLRRGILNHVVV